MLVLRGLVGKWQTGGAKRVLRFEGWKPYYRARPPKPVLEGSESRIGSGLCPLPARKMTCGDKQGGGETIIGGGSKAFEFSTPLKLVLFL